MDVHEEEVNGEAFGAGGGLGQGARSEEADVGQFVHHGALDEEGRDRAVLEQEDDGMFGIQGRRMQGCRE